MKKLSIAAALLAVAVPMMAQSQAGAPAGSGNPKSSIAVFPYKWTASYWTGYGYGYRDISEPAFNRTLQGISELSNFTAIDATAQEQVKAALYDATSGAAMNSTVQLEMGKKLQARYLFRGNVEGVHVNRAYEKDRKTYYGATIDVNLEVVDVETGAVALAQKLTSNNGFALMPEDCKGNIMERVKCEAQRKVTAHTVEEANKQAASLLKSDDADTPAHALMSAVDKLHETVQNFLNAGVTAGKIK